MDQCHTRVKASDGGGKYINNSDDAGKLSPSVDSICIAIKIA